MTKINVFDSWEDAWNQLIKPHYEKNLETRIELGKWHELKRQEYIDVSGYGGKFRKEQEKKLPHVLKTTHPKTGKEIEFVFPYSEHDFDAHNFALPKEEHEKFLRVYQNIGEGLELMCVVLLNVMGKKCLFQQVQDALLVPPTKSRMYYEYRSIPKLVKNVKEYLQEQNKMYQGARVNVSFFTINTEELLFSAEQKEGAKESLQELKSPEYKKECGEVLEGASFWEKLEFKFSDFMLASVIKALSKYKGTIRGLNRQEIEEFERLYVGVK